MSGLRRPEDSVSDYVIVISDCDEWLVMLVIVC